MFKKIEEPFKASFQFHVRDFAGCGWIRAIIPSIMVSSAEHPILNGIATYTDRITLSNGAYDGINYAVFQRTDNEVYANAMHSIKEIRQDNCFITYDIDDDLFNIPEYNYAADYFKDKLDAVKKCLGASDIVTVSTKQLKKLYTPYCDNVIISPNLISQYLWGGPGWKDNRNSKLRILYAGSDNHFSVDKGDDGGDFSQELCDFIEGTKDKYEWVFFGGVPQYFRRKGMEGLEHHPWNEYLNYINKVKTLKIDVSIAPLIRNTFNKGKSNIKAQEAMALGAPFIGESFGPYKNIPYSFNTIEELKGTIESFESRDKRQKAYKQQIKRLGPNLYWETNNNTVRYINRYLRASFGVEVDENVSGKYGPITSTEEA